jgi:predicted ATPase/DNA-binding SARP family transcriptional activator
LARANRVVSIDGLIEGLWRDSPPDGAAATVQVYVSQLRKALEPDRKPREPYNILATKSPGYFLRLDADQLDVYGFELLNDAGTAALYAGDAQAAANSFRQALDMWRGEALADFASEPWALAEASRLNEMRLHALEQRIEAELALGRHAQLIAELESLVAEHPLRERLCGQLMLALYRSSRQAEASDIFQRTRERLVGDLGMEPGPELQKLLRQVINQDPELNGPAPAPPRFSPARGGLPTPLTPFVDRDDEISELRELVTANRLLTVTGPGGIGKTRLAIRLAKELEASFAGGAWLCDLAPLADATLIADALANALGVMKDTADLTSTREFLRGRTMLLVLDNCEHLLRSAAEVAQDLLAACSGLKIISTSREPLGLLGEAVLRLDALPENAAVQLFVQRAAAAGSGFILESANAATVAAVCRRLDCIPLALELAAPRLRVVDVEELIESLLDQSWHGRSPDRHGSLDAVAAWSYHLLDPLEQKLFRRLSVFGSWFDADDATAMAADLIGVPALLAGLVEKSMLVREHHARPNSYRLLETIKSFAHDRLREAEEIQEARLMHAERMVWLVEGLGIRSLARERHLWTKVAGMVDDVRLAMSSLLELQPRRAAWLAGSLRWFWRNTGRLTEGVHSTQIALEANPEPSLERCWALHGQAILQVRHGNRSEAKRCLEDGVALAALPECESMRGEFLLAQAIVHAVLGNLTDSEATDRKAIDEFVRTGSLDRVAFVENDLAMMLLAQGRAEESRASALRSVEGMRRADSGVLNFALDSLAQSLALLGEIDDARQYWLESADLALANEQTVPIAACLEGLAYAAGLRQRPEIACRLHSCAANLLRESGDTFEAEPLAPKVAELMTRMNAELGSTAAARLKAEGEALTIEAALQMARTAG